MTWRRNWQQYDTGAQPGSGANDRKSKKVIERIAGGEQVAGADDYG
jgi:hypothetical protein